MRFHFRFTLVLCPNARYFFRYNFDIDGGLFRLIDFGLAKKVSKNELMTTPNGTPYYIAPEVLKGSYTT